MARFKVYHIVRDGHVQRDIVHAKTRQQALAEAKEKYDDVLKVKRDRGLSPWLFALIVIAAIAVLVALA